MDDEISLTLVNSDTGESETIPFPSATPLSQVEEVCQAVFQLSSVSLKKEGRLLRGGTLQEAGVSNGDLIAVFASPASVPIASNSPNGGSLNFSRLLASGSRASASTTAAAAGGVGGGGLDFSSLLGGAGTSNTALQPPAPVYYPNMNVNEAMEYNPHPETFITLLQSKEHLFKELNYYNPKLAAKLKGVDKTQAVQIWREELVRGGIQGALEASTKILKEKEMRERLERGDAEAQEYFAELERQEKVRQQYHQMMQEYPESLGRVLMLYISVKINGHEIQAFCDSGAQATIMSKKTARDCGLQDYIDTRFAGTAVGVGTGKILGRIHIVQLAIGKYFFPCSVTVMDDPPPGASEMPFLLGLDMMKRHQCIMDLGHGVLKWRLEGDYLETPFLHEKDLDESQGGTKGFDVAAANQRILELEEQQEQMKDDP